MGDPLSLVRQAIIAGVQVNYVNQCYEFGPHRFPESTKTCFKRTLAAAEDYYYSLRDVLFFLENADRGVAEFRRLCVEKRVTAVVEQDKQSLRSYLTGEIDGCAQLDLSVAAASVAAAAPVQSSSVRATTTTSTHWLSAEEMQEQRDRHAALIDQSVKRLPAGQSSSSSASKLEELRALRRSHKRKAGQMESDDNVFDPAFIAADQQYLSEIRSSEIPAQTRSTVLSKISSDFSFVLKLFNEHVLKPKDMKAPTGTTPGKSPASGASAHGSSSGANIMAGKSYSTPIIIVPAVITSLISSLNVVDFLEKGNYVTNEKKKADGAKRLPVQLVRRKLPSGQVLEYKVVDTILEFEDKDWDRVVAVFATGQDWQFKGWKWSKPVELFAKTLGIHVTMDDRTVDQKVLDWNCKILKIKQFKRHYDAGIVNEFWLLVDSFMKANKPWLILPPNAKGHHSSNHASSAGSSNV